MRGEAGARLHLILIGLLDLLGRGVERELQIVIVKIVILHESEVGWQSMTAKKPPEAIILPRPQPMR
jgi:hypothetical protein